MSRRRGCRAARKAMSSSSPSRESRRKVIAQFEYPNARFKRGLIYAVPTAVLALFGAEAAAHIGYSSVPLRILYFAVSVACYLLGLAYLSKTIGSLRMGVTIYADRVIARGYRKPFRTKRIIERGDIVEVGIGPRKVQTPHRTATKVMMPLFKLTDGTIVWLDGLEDPYRDGRGTERTRETVGRMRSILLSQSRRSP